MLSHENLKSFLRVHGITAVVVLVAALTQLYVLSRPLDFLLTNLLPDDAFYYFEIARNIAQGFGSTFDGLTPTNGYHPLWMLVLSPLYALGNMLGWEDTMMPIRAALLLSLLMNIGTIICVSRILARYTAHIWVQGFGLMFFALNPFFLYGSLNGLETSASLFLFSVFFLYTLSLHSPVSVRALTVLGALGGIMVLARLDYIFYVAAVFIWLFFSVSVHGGVRRVLIAGCACAVFIVPFFLFNYLNFDMVLTSASGANELVNQVLIEQDHGGGFFQMVKASVYSLHLQFGELMTRTGAPELALIFIGAFLVSVALGKVFVPRTFSEVRPIHAFIVGFFLLFLINVAVRLVAREWYFISFGVLLSIAVVVVLDVLAKNSSWPVQAKKITLILLVFVTASLFFTWWHKEQNYPMVQQREMYATAQWFNEHVPPQTSVAMFNAGIVGYFSNARVINIDGLVNNQAYKAMQERDLYAYMKRIGIEYVTDFDIYLDYRYRSFFGVADIRTYLLEVARPALGAHTRGGNGIGIYQFIP